MYHYICDMQIYVVFSKLTTIHYTYVSVQFDVTYCNAEHYEDFFLLLFNNIYCNPVHNYSHTPHGTNRVP